MALDKRAMIGARIAKEFKDGDYVNLGIGLPTEAANHIPEGISVIFQSENGLLGAGPKPPEGQEDKDMINAGGGYITCIPGASFFDSATSFAIIRGGHIDATVLGALQVDQEGNLANWLIPGKMVPGMGGAMDLVTGAKKVIVAMEHCDKYGNSKILKKCTLPLTAKGKVNLIITDMAVIEVCPEGLYLREIAEGLTIDDVVQATEAELIIPERVNTF
ncbi:MAG: CoA transferase subunit B [Candidatus Cloacimonadota bacterium]|jgi:acetate CoA/acetoacetate CoA-transferase beta subunit|uniref:Acetoacetate:butyrate CoA-transferase beta subunit n=1 Tax=Cloacimonas acidaminovorans (strain Evry) TaxID=459349 RepID=B0VIH2_CLOAI|nr:CoA transferase subunit B [Candidatus Cloacimonas acidaminovorans]MDI9572102.1 CoA transferase subunit B [Candidatus Cloacimonadota bacterium]HRS60535.1 CoA transferase subunit B [Candidatus Cloacimonas sp.]MDD3606013.1 CoA transferase subunit B [Candidatus Cloacimonas acidaminovorans]NLM91252.1 CoA transferase subunit B [Candidatus Cloacimonadota bacterium]CAO79961.1 Acetoacetate:butyrate CoA-transferase beta subunit [Candidatus Cloacimonas acidaminovorans str. Evry]